MNVAFLGMGGNLGDQRAGLHSVLRQLAENGCLVTKVSRFYITAPWGSQSLNNYTNIAVEINCDLNATELHTLTIKIETAEGRVRTSEQNADRTMDIDLLCFNQEVITSEFLKVPHPRMHLRPFVMQPLAEIAPHFIHPVLGKNFADLAEEVGTEGILEVIS